MKDLTREEVINFLRLVRPDMWGEDWKKSDLITVLKWAIPTYIAWMNNGILSETTPIDEEEDDD